MALNESIVGQKLPERRSTWSEADVMLYALGVGASPPVELNLLYEGLGPAVLPTFALIANFEAVKGVGQLLEGERFPMVHASQSLEMFQPLEPAGSISAQATVTALWDKGKHALIELTTEGSSDTGPVFRAVSGTMVLGAGGWGGERGPSTSATEPDRLADLTYSDRIRPEQAAIYRLSGDRNPIHIDPEAARQAGFDDVFAHGLCSMGFAARALTHSLADGDPERLLSISCRFSARVRLDAEFETRIWRSSPGATEVTFVSTQDGGTPLTDGRATLRAIG